MYGAILGDMIGAPYEFDRGDKTNIMVPANQTTPAKTHVNMVY